MKTQSITLHAPRNRSRSTVVHGIRFRTDSLACLALAVLLSATAPAALVILATWATGVPTLLPAIQAATGLSGFVFLALAIDSGGLLAALKAVTAAALFVLAYASMALASELVVAATMIAAAWLGAATFVRMKRNCL